MVKLFLMEFVRVPENREYDLETLIFAEKGKIQVGRTWDLLDSWREVYLTIQMNNLLVSFSAELNHLAAIAF